jgi:hypothetical protein
LISDSRAEMGGVLGEFLDFHMVFLEEVSEACIFSRARRFREQWGYLCLYCIVKRRTSSIGMVLLDATNGRVEYTGGLIKSTCVFLSLQ